MIDKQTPKPQFTWHKIDSELRVKHSERFHKIPLKPNLLITFKNHPQPPLETRLHIDIEKSLQYQDGIGWNWHKSSNLPIFSVKLNILNNQTGNILTPPQLKAKIYAVKIVKNTFEKGEKLYLGNIGIKGENQIQLIEGCGSFNSLRFSSTSYNNEGVNFHLLIVVYNNENQSEIPENIICSVISPPIFVDSRKSARNYQEKKYLSFVQLFNPNELQKLFAKRESKQEMDDRKIISNSDQGLFNYLTAPNIRHKVKHPLFLSVRFSNAFKIYVNTNSKNFYQKQISLNAVINRLQKKLIKEIGLVRRQKQSQFIHEKEFVIILQFQSMLNEKQKIIQMLEYLDCHSITLSDQNSLIDKDFLDISQLGDIMSIYKSEYFSLKRKSENEISQRKTQQNKKQKEQHQFQKDNQSQFKQKSLFQRINEKEEERFSHSYISQNQRQQAQNAQQIKQNKFSPMRALGMSLKKIKQNENALFTQNQNIFKYPLQQHFSKSFVQDHLRLQNQQYPKFMFDFGGMEHNQIVKKEEEGTIIYVSEKQIVQKIKHMCIQVYQRNKNSILTYLETLKKSNIKWKVKDVEQFIFTYSSALMNAVFFRQKLLHHMLLQNQILKAKVGIMQQMAISDIEGIKSNIMSMNKFLPKKFILDKLRQNSLWTEELNTQKKPIVAQIKPIKEKPKEIQVIKNQQHESRNENTQKMVEQVSSSEVEQSFSCECKFVSNVFELESPSVRQ